MLSAKKNPQIIEDYLAKECAAGNILGPFPLNTLAVHINRFGAIPKKYHPGKWRLITDLSYPEGHSINDAINPELCAMSYITVDQVAKTAVSLGKGALITKISIKSAYRLVPICGLDRKWLGMRWNDRLYVDSMLPFGLRSAPKIFNSLAEWVVVQEGIEFIFHYLDDFAVLGPPDSPECQRALDILSRTCAPLASEKQDGPCPVIVLLGILIDTLKQELRLPEEKLRRLLDMLAEWEKKKSCTRQELESLIGTLHHACKVIPSGRSFLRQAISLLSVAKKKDLTSCGGRFSHQHGMERPL